MKTAQNDLGNEKAINVCKLLATVCFTLLSIPALAQPQQSDPNNTSTSSPSASSSNAEVSLAQQIQQLNWIHGPATLHMPGSATFRIPQGYEMLAPPDAIKFIQLNGNLTSEDDRNDYMLWSESTSTDWFAILYYEDIGHVSDTDTINSSALLDDMRTNNDAINVERQKSGLTTMALTGWAIQPNYDQQTHRLEWAFNFQTPDGRQTTHFHTRVLGRTGDMHIIVVDSPSALAADLPDFNYSMNGFSFVIRNNNILTIKQAINSQHLGLWDSWAVAQQQSQ